MRLICPRCGAQYEVDDVVIPAAGRDVQCSGCGQTWFQPSRAMLDAAQEQARDDADRLDGWDVAEGTAPTEPEPAPDPDPEGLAGAPARRLARDRAAGPAGRKPRSRRHRPRSRHRVRGGCRDP
ncbi:zinc-ribbon domain-containing protein [Rhodobacter capsulatus]|uniref:zinc-ribbon domain-containing protein n=1 Tax=Rhodobacter capsulatus TaxID=1061 RepID=UPI004024D2A3